MDAHIKQLRADGKTSSFCLQVTPERLDDIISLLLHQPALQRSQKVDLIATISNILLLNRQLHAYFTSRWATPVLDYLHHFLGEVLPEIDSHAAAHSETPSEAPDFSAFVIVYRLVFLILYDGLPEVQPYVDETNDVLIQGLHIVFQHYESYKNAPFYENVTVEILKGLYTLVHKYGDVMDKSRRIAPEKCMEFLSSTVPPAFSSLNPNQVVLVRYFINLILVVSTQGPLDKPRILENGDTYHGFVSTVIQLIARNLQESETEDNILDLTNLFIILNFIIGKCNKENNEGDLDSLLNIAKIHLLPKGAPARPGSFDIPSSLETSQSSISSVLPVTESTIYHKCFTLIQKTQSSLTSKPLADQLSFSNVTNVILQCYYNLCHSDDQTKRFLDLVGYGYAKDFMQNHEIAVPTDIDLGSYLHPNPKYLAKVEEKPPFPDFTEFSHSLSSILSNHTRGTSSEPEEMTKKEKEIEAEKLFGIFDKMEKSSVFEGFKNPVREWQQSGRFEDISDSDSD